MSNVRQTRSTSRFARFWSLWISCGSCVGRFVVFGYVWFFGSGLRVLLLFVVFVGRWSCPRCQCRRLRVRSCLCGFWSRVIVSILEIVAKDINVPRITGDGTCGFCGSVVLPSMLDAAACASSCSLWTAKKICPSPHFVLCSISSPLEATFTNGENDHG